LRCAAFASSLSSSLIPTDPPFDPSQSLCIAEICALHLLIFYKLRYFSGALIARRQMVSVLKPCVLSMRNACRVVANNHNYQEENTMQSSSLKFLSAALFAAFALAGCGGGGGDDSSSTLASLKLPTTTLSGVYDGTLTDTSQPLTTLLQADGSYYMIYSDASDKTPKGVVLGTGALAFAGFSSQDARDLSLVGNGKQAVVEGNLSASYTQGASFNGNLLLANTNYAFTGSANNSFKSLPALETMAGVYIGSIATKDLKEEKIKLTIDSSGRLSGELSCGCTVNATLAARDDGTSYVAKLAFTGGSHSLSNKSMAGNVYLDVANKRLYIVGYLGATTDGAVFVGTRS
jgi:hypothetical protein